MKGWLSEKEITDGEREEQPLPFIRFHLRARELLRQNDNLFDRKTEAVRQAHQAGVIALERNYVSLECAQRVVQFFVANAAPRLETDGLERHFRQEAARFRTLLIAHKKRGTPWAIELHRELDRNGDGEISNEELLLHFREVTNSDELTREMIDDAVRPLRQRARLR